MARLFFPALNKLEADNERLRNRIVTLEADLLSKTKERNQSNQVGKSWAHGGPWGHGRVGRPENRTLIELNLGQLMPFEI